LIVSLERGTLHRQAASPVCTNLATAQEHLQSPLLGEGER
jgi:hypothetical protein